ncbi:MAG: glycosyltransferase family 4 protein [Desulfurococcales archaeon]|nr:glycosyltransferase family 4 protein [Desulfurococcales archaeon]
MSLMDTKKCRIAFVWHKSIDKFFIGKDVYAISSRLAKLGYETYLIVDKYKIKNYNIDNLNIIELKFSGHSKIHAILWGFQVFNVLKSIRPNIIMYLHPYLGHIISGILFKLFYGKNIFLYMKLDYNGKKPRNILKQISFAIRLYLILIVFDLISIETKCARSRLIQWLKPPYRLSNKIIVIPDGYNDNVFNVSENNKREKLIITVARIVKSKGIDIVVKAFKLLQSRYPDWELVIIGPIVDKKYYKDIYNYIKKYNLNVKFLGKLSQEQISEYYKRAYIFVLPTLSESFGLARVEAAAQGLPVITTAVPCRYDLENYGFILLDNPTDVNELYNKIRMFIEDVNYRDAVASRSRKSLKSWSDITLLILNEINKRKSKYIKCKL